MMSGLWWISTGKANEMDFSLIGAFGCLLDVYADGNLIAASLTTVYPQVNVVRIPDNFTTVAVTMVSQNTYSALFKGFTNDRKLVTDGKWKSTSSTPASNWMNNDFDDSSWNNANTITTSFAYIWYSMPQCNSCNASATWFSSGSPLLHVAAQTMYYREHWHPVIYSFVYRLHLGLYHTFT